MQLHYLKHVPFEGLGSIASWVDAHDIDISVTRFYADDPLPDLDEIDWLVIMGGPMNIYETEKYPWLAEEKTFIRQAIETNKIVLGICLGAQLIADVLGARVYAGVHREIGWFPVKKSPRVAETILADVLPVEAEVLHWHGDTFDVPRGALPLGHSAACRNQGFVFSERVVALQFHLETTPQGLQALIDHCGNEIVDGPFIQSPEALLSDAQRFETINRLMARLLDRLAQR